LKYKEFLTFSTGIFFVKFERKRSERGMLSFSDKESLIIFLPAGNSKINLNQPPSNVQTIIFRHHQHKNTIIKSFVANCSNCNNFFISRLNKPKVAIFYISRVKSAYIQLKT
jgi:hypothetical protein